MQNLLSPQPKNKPVLSVTELNGQAKRLLEVNFHRVWVEGEISGLVKPRSGHWYFTLKDDHAQIRCAMFKNRNQLSGITPAEGMQVCIRGRVSLYENRGDYQLITDHISAAGSGALQKAFERLKEKLAKEGLFDNQDKRPLPIYPKHIIIVTSTSGAAIRDIIAIFKRRAPFIQLSIIPSAVQGEDAADQLVNALSLAKKINSDALIIGRGGGSVEDLWSFNDERLARAIAEYPVPVVSAVGHETDFTIADFVADYRAPTPSAAAEILSPDRTSLIGNVQKLNHKIIMLTRQRIKHASEKLFYIYKRLKNPNSQLKEYTQRLDNLEIRMDKAVDFLLEINRAHLQRISSLLQQQSPKEKMKHFQQHLNDQIKLLYRLTRQQLTERHRKLHYLSGKLNAISPLSTLARGYVIAKKDAKIVRSYNELQVHDEINLVLHQGSAKCTVNKVCRNKRKKSIMETT
ncbi:MAG: exodeoxyribonuclease VII large subunit [Endozoicomonas sp. (ex Botrylloides leachii)]|nr:exodeoxyribonuclease VII large subunit [Endozoicomonas sp. (ex Botrylloides leachii)]